MKLKRIKKLMISGITVTTNNNNEKDEATEKIAPLWGRYSKENIDIKTHNKVDNYPFYAVYSNYTSDLNGDFDVTVGVEVTKPKNVIIIENEKYLVFTKQGELPEVAFEAWEEIWEYFANEDECEHERNYTIDFEMYSKIDEIDIYISIK